MSSKSAPHPEAVEAEGQASSLPGLAILGGGFAGLSLGHYARQAGLPFTIYESSDHVGGLSLTFRHEGFSFDSGAHRLHDKDSHTTHDAMALLGHDLHRVDAPSQLFDNGRLIAFPFSLTDMIQHLGPEGMLRAGVDFLGARLSPRRAKSFADVAVGRYGRAIARRFLINYTEKLWGQPCERLVPELSGGRLRGLDLRQVVRGSLGNRGHTRHLEGRFYYPRCGIGMFTDRLRDSCGVSSIATGSRVTRVEHTQRRITSVVTSTGPVASAGIVVSTIPLDILVETLDPPPPRPILAAAASLRYRDIVLGALFLDEPSVTRAATVYFPDSRFPFTRLVEPRNRSAAMSPDGRTSLLAEIPCDPGGEAWNRSDDAVIASILESVEEIGWVRPDHLLGAAVERLTHAYPVITLEARNAVGRINRYLADFENLRLLGRNGQFRYAWMHDLMRDARALIRSLRTTPQH